MKLMNILKNFRNDENGAVTVDWVVLTAAIVGLGLVVMQTVGDGVVDLGDKIAGDVSKTTVGFKASPAEE
jgi:Flp pilus assembly pilin Flp